MLDIRHDRNKKPRFVGVDIDTPLDSEKIRLLINISCFDEAIRMIDEKRQEFVAECERIDSLKPEELVIVYHTSKIVKCSHNKYMTRATKKVTSYHVLLKERATDRVLDYFDGIGKNEKPAVLEYLKMLKEKYPNVEVK